MMKVRRIGLSKSAIRQNNIAKRMELNIKWDVISNRGKRKIEKLTSTNGGTRDIPDIVEGVVIDNESLESMYGKVCMSLKELGS